MNDSKIINQSNHDMSGIATAYLDTPSRWIERDTQVPKPWCLAGLMEALQCRDAPCGHPFGREGRSGVKRVGLQ